MVLDLLIQISKLVKIEHCKLEMSSIQEAMTSDILKKLSSVNADERSKSLETIQGLNLSPEKTQLMLASALSLLLKSDITPSAASPSFNADRSYRGDSEWDRRPHRQNSWKRYDSYDNRGYVFCYKCNLVPLVDELSIFEFI